MATKKPAAAPAKAKPGPKAKPRPAPAPRKAKAPVHATAKKAKAATQERRFTALRAKAAKIGDPLAVDTKPIALRSTDRHLTEMQMMFVRHWAAGESILSASARAGYSDNGTYAYRLVKDPLVIAIFEREKKLYEASCQMTRGKVMQGFLDAADMAKLQADPTAMTGAWREVGKMCGYYEPVKKTIDININGQVTARVERMDDATLLAIVKGEIGTDVIEQEMREILESETA